MDRIERFFDRLKRKKFTFKDVRVFPEPQEDEPLTPEPTDVPTIKEAYYEFRCKLPKHRCEKQDYYYVYSGFMSYTGLCKAPYLDCEYMEKEAKKE